MSYLKILLVEDSPSLRRVNQKLLEACGFRVRAAEHGADALAILNSEEFNVIVSDIGMPVMDGFEFARRVRAIPAHSNKRLVALTAYSLPSLVQQAREVGFDSYLIKPINMADLRDVILSRPVQSDHLRLSASEQRAQGVAPTRSPARNSRL